MINDCKRARECGVWGVGSRTWSQGHSIDINVLLSTAHAHAGAPTHARPNRDIYMTGAFWRRRWHWRHFRPTRESGKSGKAAKVRQQQLSFVAKTPSPNFGIYHQHPIYPQEFSHTRGDMCHMHTDVT